MVNSLTRRTKEQVSLWHLPDDAEPEFAGIWDLLEDAGGSYEVVKLSNTGMTHLADYFVKLWEYGKHTGAVHKFDIAKGISDKREGVPFVDLKFMLTSVFINSPMPMSNDEPTVISIVLKEYEAPSRYFTGW